MDDSNESPLLDAKTMARIGFVDRLRMEFRWENISHDGDYPKTYGRLNYVLAFGSGETSCMCCRAKHERKDSQFISITPWKWLAWRWFVCLYLVGVFLYSIIDAYDKGRWFYYLTNWQTTVFALYGTSALVTCLLLRRDHWEELNTTFSQSNAILNSRAEYRIPFHVRITWFLHGLAMSCGVEVMLMFWTMVPATPQRSDTSWVVLSLIDHMSTTTVVIVDFYFCAFPWLLLQFVWSAMFVSVYSFWTVLHYNMGLGNKFDEGNYIYPPVDWSKPGQTFALIIFGIVFALPLVNLAIWVLSSEAITCCKYVPHRKVPWIPVEEGGEAALANGCPTERDLEHQQEELEEE